MEAGGIDETEAATVMKKMLEAVAYLHGIGMVHRDIKVLRARQHGGNFGRA